MEQQSLNFGQTFRRVEARAKRDVGIAQAIDHADAITPKWSHMAYESLREFLIGATREFMGEDVRSYAHNHGLPLPLDARAWGGVMLKAARSGLIVKVGYGVAKDPKVHCSVNPLWSKVKQ